jgi:transcriptional regulator with XRE-family HTH domain
MKRELSPWGKQCKMQMVAMNKTLTDLSKATDLSRTYISAIINGRVIPPYETKHAISKALDVDIELS